MDAVMVFWILLAYCIFLTVIMVYSFSQTPLKYFLKAKIFGGKLIFKKIKGLRVMKFDIAKDRTSGVLKAKKGYYYKTEDSGFMIQPGNIPCFMASSSQGQTVHFELLEVIQALELKYGAKISTYEELQGYVRYFNDNNPDKPIKIPSSITIRPRDLDLLFPQNLNVDQQEALIGLEKHKARLGDRLNITHGIIIFIILIGAGVGFFLINNALQGDVCPACTCVYEGIKNVTQAGSNIVVGGG